MAARVPPESALLRVECDAANHDGAIVGVSADGHTESRQEPHAANLLLPSDAANLLLPSDAWCEFFEIHSAYPPASPIVDQASHGQACASAVVADVSSPHSFAGRAPASPLQAALSDMLPSAGQELQHVLRRRLSVTEGLDEPRRVVATRKQSPVRNMRDGLRRDASVSSVSAKGATLEKLARKTEKAESMRRQWEAVLLESRGEELEATKVKLDAARAENSLLRDRAGVERSERKKQSARCGELEETVANLGRQVNELKRLLARGGAESGGEVTLLRSEVKAMQRREETFRSEISKLGYENRKLQEAKDRATRLMAESKGGEFEETVAKLADVRLSNSHLSARVEDLQQEISQLGGHLNHRQKIQHLQNVTTENKTLREKLEKAWGRIAQLEQLSSRSRVSDLIGSTGRASDVLGSTASAGSSGNPSTRVDYEHHWKPPKTSTEQSLRPSATSNEQSRVSAGLRRILKPTAGGA